MFVPNSYKQLRDFFVAPSARETLLFTGDKEIFSGSVFYPFVFRGRPAEGYPCPYCNNVCNVHTMRSGEILCYCRWCEEEVELTPQDLEHCELSIEALVQGIAKHLGYPCQKQETYWYFGKPVIAKHFRNLYFSPYPTRAIVDKLLVSPGSLLFTFNAPVELFVDYPQQIYTMADLQVKDDSLDIHLDWISEVQIIPQSYLTSRNQKDKRATLIAEIVQQFKTELISYKEWFYRQKSYPREKYTFPSCGDIAERIKKKGISTSSSAISRLGNSKQPDCEELSYLYKLIYKRKTPLEYQDTFHRRAINTVNR